MNSLRTPGECEDISTPQPSAAPRLQKEVVLVGNPDILAISESQEQRQFRPLDTWNASEVRIFLITPVNYMPAKKPGNLRIKTS